MRLLSFFLFICITTLPGLAQTLPLPADYQQAYTAGTRSLDGKPGPKYWINHADYTLQATARPPERMLDCSGRIIYYNNSPNTLDMLVLRIYQDLFKRGNARDFAVDAGDLHDGVAVYDVAIGSETLPEAAIRREGTNMLLFPAQKIHPRSSVTITMRWKVQLPRESKIRMGIYDSTTFLAGYWYPQVAVYDDVHGWDELDYTGQQEFYNDFNNYQVSITVPDNYYVWATGVLDNYGTVLQGSVLQRYTQALTSEAVVRIVDSTTPPPPTTVSGTRTWEFKAEHVPDFVFGISNHYYWDARSVLVDDATGRTALVSAAYRKESKDFYEVAEIAAKVIRFFSVEMPGVPYPYPNMTVFNGSGGMEFPMLVNDGSTNSRSSTVSLTGHEIAHTYFPFYMGINERRFAWMDEGWAVVLHYDFHMREVPNAEPRTRASATLSKFMGNEQELPCIVPSNQTTGTTYRTASYMRPAAAYYFLQDLLGKELFTKALRQYMALWNGKHPLPYDFFFSMENTAGQDLSWYFKPWFFERGYADLSIASVERTGDAVQVTIKKKGIVPVPVRVRLIYKGGVTKEVYQTAAAWKNSDTFTCSFSGAEGAESIILGDDIIPDRFPGDNTLPVK